MQDSNPRSYLWLFIALAVAGFVADQASKYVVFAALYPDEDAADVRSAVTRTQVDIIPGAFALTAYYTQEIDPGDEPLSFLRTISGGRRPNLNTGALFGIGSDMNTFFAIVSVVAGCFIVCWATRPVVARDRWLCIAFGLILAGTTGNLYDRIVFGGVRDFLDWYRWFKWADFNIADCCLVCGAGVLLAHSVLTPEKAEAPAQADGASSQAPVPVETTSSAPGA